MAAISKTGTSALAGDLMTCIEELKAAEQASDEVAEEERNIQNRMQQEARERIEHLRSERVSQRQAQQQQQKQLEDDDHDVDDLDIEVEYRH
jgi:GTP-binding protein